MSAYLEGRTTRLSSTETSRSRSSQEDFLCGDPPAVAAEPQYHPGPLGGGTTHSGRKPGGSSSSDVQYRCDPVEVRVSLSEDILTAKGLIYINSAVNILATQTINANILYDPLVLLFSTTIQQKMSFMFPGE